MATERSIQDHPAIVIVFVLAAVATILGVILQIVRKQSADAQQQTSQTVGSQNRGPVGQAARDISQQVNNQFGGQHNDDHHREVTIEAPQQNGGTGNTQINGSRIDHLTINPGEKEKDPDTVDGARDALGRMKLSFDEEGFAQANREPDLDAIKLYLRGGKSPNSTYDGTFMLCLPLMKKSSKFPKILELYQSEGLEPLHFDTKVGASSTPVQAIMTRANPSYTMADILFRQLAYEDDEYARAMGHLLWDAGANPSFLLQSLQSDKSSMERFLSNPQNRQNDAMQRKFHMINTSTELERTNKQLAFLQSVIPNQ